LKRPDFALLIVALGLSQSLAAQELAPSAPNPYALNAKLPVDPDKAMHSEMASSRQKIASSVDGYLVAFDSKHDGFQKRVGLPLTTFGDSPVGLAYDLTGKNLMAQWNLSQGNSRGDKLNYRAFLGQTGDVSFVIRASF
jgi:hypothetical protein